MATTRKAVNDWFDEAKRKGVSHLIIARNILDDNEFPVYVGKPEDFWVQHKLYDDPKKLTRVAEVYDISLPKEEQLNEHTAWHTPPIEVK